MKTFDTTVRVKILVSILTLFMILCGPHAFPEETSGIPQGLRSLARAYPDSVLRVEPNAVVFRNGTRLRYDDGRRKTGFEDLLEHASLFDQMRLSYPKGRNYSREIKDFDPGRIRNEEFFLHMYGRTEEAVKKNLVTVPWPAAGLGASLRVTAVNGVDRALRRVSEEIMERPHLVRFADNPAGTFSWRTIRGTSRLSMHSLGIAIDLNTAYSSYWLDDLASGKPLSAFRNGIPMELVEIFERNGFIWGGKWYHYDTMHFEYRPELITPEFSRRPPDDGSPRTRERLRP